ncbi:MAG: putative oxidoreductase [Chloroflexi bacterium ADurb.Bin180]|nr:MAG: putative oxidoreductase [Chloroflexi bacterium ADurb.Bin180]
MIVVDPKRCAYCGCCVSVCPVGALDLQETRLTVSDACIDCLLCVAACPMGAISACGGRPASLAKTHYDVIIVGAGPAGSVTAWEAARLGLSVLLLEKRQEIGSPVRCAEGITHSALASFLPPDPRWISATIRTASIHVVEPTREQEWVPAQEPAEDAAMGYVLERRVFDRVLAEQAAAAGARVMVKTAAEGLLRDGQRVVGVRVRGPSGAMDITARVTVGADGVESRVGAWAGIDTTLAQADLMSCAQYLMAGVETDPHTTVYYLDQELAPGGYAWIFPKGDGRANVGLGVQAGITEKAPIELLNRFVDKYPFLSRGNPVTLVSGGVPVGLPPAQIVADGLLLVGDAARQVDPLTGGGIANGMEAGRLAAQVVAEALDVGDTSAKALGRYAELWSAGRGKDMARNLRLRRRFAPEQRTDERFLRLFALSIGAAK